MRVATADLHPIKSTFIHSQQVPSEIQLNTRRALRSPLCVQQTLRLNIMSEALNQEADCERNPQPRGGRRGSVKSWLG